ncbi:hypothetical protein Caci_2652 [Catenulispora acidiphila DSM 44928]|uniref:Uncharacterized protein n=1 Tax=Catenulispora acidiphila (strain DSM 44928 / JCM 14897 / NBRC 102108 / NRRL B-24433 / ID139908) TaxID=479433 RepID=C7PZB1_CATAD|nr:hypothetical protein Caci_2652 [Catenulispora acidiphila DSM 44928]
MQGEAAEFARPQRMGIGIGIGSGSASDAAMRGESGELA